MLLAVVPPLLLGWTAHTALYRSMIFLVVASPCALAAAMMPTLLSALSNGARSGVLFKGSAFVEAVGHVTVVAFDKTGTLTTGAPRVTNVVPLDGESVDRILATAAAIEHLSSHPLGRAIVAEARRRGLDVPAAVDHEDVPGLGARASVGGQRSAIGKPGMFASVAPDVLEQRRRFEAEGKTVVLVGEGAVRGLVALRDIARPEARAAIAALRRLGVRRVVMLTGDGATAARAIADEAGVDELHADLLPEEKTRVVEALVRQHGHVAMVGDGVNDAPALAAATVGIAMGAAGTDVALETADVVLTTDDLAKIPYAISLGRRALGVVKQNLVVALGVIVTLVVADLLGQQDQPPHGRRRPRGQHAAGDPERPATAGARPAGARWPRGGAGHRRCSAGELDAVETGMGGSSRPGGSAQPPQGPQRHRAEGAIHGTGEACTGSSSTKVAPRHQASALGADGPAAVLRHELRFPRWTGPGRASPCARCVDVSALPENESKTKGRKSGDMPSPSSRTTITTR